jgi:hypothetical protein
LIKTGADAQHAIIAFVAVNFPTGFFGDGYGIFGAGADARAATNAENISGHEIRRKILRFRIGTPDTFQRTSFEKNSSSYSGAIVNAETLNIEDEAFFQVACGRMIH